MKKLELEARMIYAMIVAGKSAKFADGVTNRLIGHLAPGEMPLEMIRRIARSGALNGILRECRSGSYTKLTRGFTELAESSLDLRTCSAEALEAIHGIGPKTARFFILWTRPGARYAALDRHILRWLKEQGYKVPESTPSGKRYKDLEKSFLAEADKHDLSPRELDSKIWEEYSGYRGEQ